MQLPIDEDKWINYIIILESKLKDRFKVLKQEKKVSNNFQSGKLSSKNLHNFLKLATTESSFIFDNKLYKQTDGVAMGSPLGHKRANVFLCHYEKTWLNECPSQFKPAVYRRYVDDIFVLFKSKEHLSLCQLHELETQEYKIYF